MGTGSHRQRILDGIEALYPADACQGKVAVIGQVLLSHALNNASYNWRELPVGVLERYLAVCEDYERHSTTEDGCPRGALPFYLRH